MTVMVPRPAAGGISRRYRFIAFCFGRGFQAKVSVSTSLLACAL
jgi:hypothetical protein